MELGTNSALQLLPCRKCALDWFISPFLSPFIRLFLTLTSEALRLLYLLDNEATRSFSPNLYITAWHVLRKNHRDLRARRKDMQTGLSFCRLTSLMGMGLKQTKSKWIPNGYLTKHVPFSPNLYTTAEERNVLRNDLCDLRKWRTCKLAFPSAVDVAGDGSTKPIFKKWIPN
jgi:hypothetical protein